MDIQSLKEVLASVDGRSVSELSMSPDGSFHVKFFPQVRHNPFAELTEDDPDDDTPRLMTDSELMTAHTGVKVASFDEFKKRMNG